MRQCAARQVHHQKVLSQQSFAALFSTDQSEFGFDLVGGNGGDATVDFFRRDGSLIDRIVLSSLSNQRPA